MVEVFKTDVRQNKQAKLLIKFFLKHFPQHRINFDLSDCDKILRVEGKNIPTEKIIDVLKTNNFQCQVL